MQLSLSEKFLQDQIKIDELQGYVKSACQEKKKKKKVSHCFGQTIKKQQQQQMRSYMMVGLFWSTSEFHGVRKGGD